MLELLIKMKTKILKKFNRLLNIKKWFIIIIKNPALQPDFKKKQNDKLIMPIFFC